MSDLPLFIHPCPKYTDTAAAWTNKHKTIISNTPYVISTMSTKHTPAKTRSQSLNFSTEDFESLFKIEKDHTDSATNAAGGKEDQTGASVPGNEDHTYSATNAEGGKEDQANSAKNAVANGMSVTKRLITIKDKATPPAKLTGIKDYHRYRGHMKVYLGALSLLHCIEKKAIEEDTSEIDAMMDRMPIGALSAAERVSMINMLKKVNSNFNVSPAPTSANYDEQLCINKIQTTISNELYSVIQEETTAIS